MSKVAFVYSDHIFEVPLPQAQMLQRHFLESPHDSSRALGEHITEQLPDGTVHLNDSTGHFAALAIETLLSDRADDLPELRALQEVIFADRRGGGKPTRGFES
jgi:hypothetical protein